MFLMQITSQCEDSVPGRSLGSSYDGLVFFFCIRALPCICTFSSKIRLVPGVSHLKVLTVMTSEG